MTCNRLNIFHEHYHLCQSYNQDEYQQQIQSNLQSIESFLVQQDISYSWDEHFFYKTSTNFNQSHQNEIIFLKNFLIPQNNLRKRQGLKCIFSEYSVIDNNIIMERMQMNLEQFMKSYIITENLMKQIFKQLLQQLVLMHQNKYTHGDIKMSNILINVDLNMQITAKIIDFQTSSKQQRYSDMVYKPLGFSKENTPNELLKQWERFNFSQPYNPFDLDCLQVEILLFQLYTQVADSQKISSSLKDFINFVPRNYLHHIVNHKWIN